MQDLLKLVLIEARGVWRYRWIAMVVAWGICLAGWLLVFTMPDVYQARAQVFVDADSRLAEVMSDVGVAPGVGSRVFVVRQAMLGRPQLERVARETDLDLRARTAIEQEQLILKLRERISIEGGRSLQAQNLYTITFEDRDYDMAVRVVQTLLDTFVEDVLDLKEQGTDDATGYLEDQIAYYLKLLTDVERQLADFKKEHVGLLPGDSGGVFERLQSQMNVLQNLRSELQIEEDRRGELRRQLGAEIPYAPEDEAQSSGISVPGSKTASAITELENRRAILLLTYTERHPDIIAINEQLNQLYQQRDAERKAFVAAGDSAEGAANSTNPVYQSVQIALNKSGVMIAALRTQVAQQRAIVQQLRGQIDTIPEVEATYAQLTRDYAQYKTLYDELLMQNERERMGTVDNANDVVSFKIIEPPIANLEPVSPKRVLLLIGVLILGLGGGGAIAYVLHQLNPVFHDARTLRNVTGRPVLGVINMTWLERHRAVRRANFMYFSVISASLFLVFAITILLNDQFVLLMRALLGQATS